MSPQEGLLRGYSRVAMSFSRRLDWSARANRIAIARREREGRGLPTIDLTQTNPTQVGLSYPADALAAALARGAAAPYQPDPRGLRSAREALASDLSVAGDRVSPDDLILTASTSEAYSFLFKLLLDAGDGVVSMTPSYPLIEHLVAAELGQTRHVALDLVDAGSSRRWAVDVEAVVRQIDPGVRAVVVIHPNNPTGSCLTLDEQDAIAEVCRSRDIALLSDEVFCDYPLGRRPDAAPSAARRDDVLSFSLGGLSKSAALPHWKLGWIRAGGPMTQRRRALEALELIADNFLSVATPVQAALSDILPLGRMMRGRVMTRIEGNLECLRDTVSRNLAVDLLPIEGGWSAVLRVPRLMAEEDLVLALLSECGVLVQPGYFFDFATEAFLVVSLLPPVEEFRTGVERIVEYFADASS
ncbi:MAG TPA: pyridoxal phosphate-dependent aminotransferase [Thermoanaerobaculia bacterium]|nr:pyridoxal phosphate-dependent aminotransferase [Thermoanaerobaculia bacterium]